MRADEDAYPYLVDAGASPAAVHIGSFVTFSIARVVALHAARREVSALASHLRGFATVPWNGTRACEVRRQRFNSSRWHQRAVEPALPNPYLITAGSHLVRLYAGVWVTELGTKLSCQSGSIPERRAYAWRSGNQVGLLIRPSRVRIPIHALIRLFALASERAAVWCENRSSHLEPCDAATFGV